MWWQIYGKLYFMAYSTQNQTSLLNSNSIFAGTASAEQNKEVGGSVFYHYSKRILDIVLVSLSLALFLPIMAAVAIAIKVDSAGPVFYRQERVGAKKTIRNGEVEWEVKNFRIFKFRSMYTHTDDAIHQEHVRAWINGELENDESGAVAKVKNDPRITRVGHLIRKTSLDELPQLINIILGEMSIVGPRPVPQYEVDQYRDEDYTRLEALPGLTGLWQVEGRGNVSFEEMMELDTKYVRTRTLAKDISIILRTVPAVISGSGAE